MSNWEDYITWFKFINLLCVMWPLFYVEFYRFQSEIASYVMSIESVEKKITAKEL